MSSAEEQERIARELAEELRKLTVQDVLVNTLMTVSSIGYRKLGTTEESRAERDLEQTQLAIETMRALTPVLERFLPAELVRDFASAVANLQLAYAEAASERAASSDPGASEGPTPRDQTPDTAGKDDAQAAERAVPPRDAPETAGAVDAEGSDPGHDTKGRSEADGEDAVA